VKRVTLFAGHYGSGKTNLAVDYALELARSGKKTLIADLDIVNPYFRTRDSETELEKAGVRIVVSPYANSNVDVPALPDDMYSVIDDTSYHCVVDVGGDDRGALALGRLAPALNSENDYEMFMVANFFRPLTQTPEAAIAVMKEIEQASHMRFTAIINNSNLGALTTLEDVLSTEQKALKLSQLSGLELKATCISSDIADKANSNGLTPIALHFRSDWAIF